jgi:hypothetical protein
MIGQCHDHKQSPIDLSKNVTKTAECIDRHRMRYWAGECDFNEMRFEILPHVLRAYQPESNCPGSFQPQIDFSRGFPVQWLLAFTDISVPSQHTIEGISYDAEIVLSHTYDMNATDRLVRVQRNVAPLTNAYQIGNVAIMLKKGGPKHRYDFLDLYLHTWAKTAQAVYYKCFPSDIAGNLTSDLFSAFEDEAGDVIPGVDQDVDDEYRLHEPRYPGEPSQPKSVVESYYDRQWHPYDWYVKANTEVRQSQK